LGEQKWTYQQIDHYNPDELYPLFLMAGYQYNPSYFTKAEKLGTGRKNPLLDLQFRRSQ
jgi:hypothetical protein